jgi:hypothetical protein
MATDYIPRSDRKFLMWVKILFACVAEKAELWNLSPGSWAHINPPMIEKYEAAYNKAIGTNRGKVDVVAKNEARDTLRDATRKYVNEFLRYNSAITDDNRLRLGLRIRDGKSTPVHVPVSIPHVIVEHPVTAIVAFRVFDSASKRRAKPDGVHGFEIAWVILDTEPTTWAQLIHSSFCTNVRKSFRLAFKHSDRGKTLYFAIRWENTRGQKGPWTDIMSTIIA